MTRLHQLLVLLLFLTLFCSCASCTSDTAKPDKRSNQNSAAHKTPKKKSREAIGVVTMKNDGTLFFDLSDGKTVNSGDQQFLIPPNIEKYDYYLNHVSPIKPGETKDVMPW